MSEMVTVRMAKGPKAPVRFFVAPGGVSFNNQGYTMSAGDGFNSAVMTQQEAEVLTKPNAKAKDKDGKAMVDASGQGVTNRQLVAIDGGDGDLMSVAEFEIMDAASAGATADAGKEPAATAASDKKEVKKDG